MRRKRSGLWCNWELWFNEGGDMALQNDEITIIFDNLDVEPFGDADLELLEFSEVIAEEVEEIAELRRIVTETTEPEPRSYTST